VLNTTTAPNTLKTPATVPWFTYNSTVRADGERTRLSPELTYFYHSFGFAAQYYREEQKLQPSATGPAENVVTNGFYVMGSYLLTGEHRFDYSEQIEPLRNFDPHRPCCAPGAWEILYRVSRLDLDRGVFNPGVGNLADSTKYSSGATETTLGVNWYWNKWVRAQLNWEHACFDDPVALGTAPDLYLRHQDTLYARFQFIF
jgi:phosphate-selective porin OprO/OprP